MSIYHPFFDMLTQKLKRLFNKIMHRLALERSFFHNRSMLHLRLKQANMQGGPKQTIVISQVVHLGDIVACEPVIRQVREQKPGAFIVFALHHSYRELADDHPEIDHVLPLNCITEWARFAISGLFDEIIDLNIYGRTCEVCRIPWHKVDGNHGVTADSYYNHGSLIEAYCKSADIVVPIDGPRIYQPKMNMAAIDSHNLPERYVTLHAGSNEDDRQISVKTWKNIVSYINNHWNLPVIEIGLQPMVISLNEAYNRTLCGRLSILQSAEVIRRGILYLGTDSGPAHLANAVGAYGIIALGCYRNFKQYMPYSGDYAHGINCELLYHDGPVAEIPVGHVFRAIDRRLSTVTGATSH